MKTSFKNEGKMKTFFGHTKLKEFITSRTVLQEMLKEILQAEEKRHQTESWIYTKERGVPEMVTMWVNI